jgi:MFS family permease
MMARLMSGVVGPLRALRSVFANPNLRRLELALAGSSVGGWAYAVALSVFAYAVGGTGAVGLVWLIVMLPAALAAPFTGLFADRYPRQRVMLIAVLARAFALAAAASAIFAHLDAALVYLFAAIASVLARVFYPAQAALLPSLARGPEELTAANVASSTIESVGIFAGPALGGLLLAVSEPAVVFATAAATLTFSALLIGRIEPAGDAQEAASPGRNGVGRQLLGGFEAILSDGGLRVLVGLYAIAALVAGALNVLLVVSALKLLDIGQSGVGLLYSTVGLGGLLGSFAALTLVGRRRLAFSFGAAVVLFGASLALIGIVPVPALAFVLLVLVGAASTLADVACLTLLQRAVADAVLGRVFAILEGLLVGMVGVGAILTPLLIGVLGVRGALILTGAALPLVAALAWSRLIAIDATAHIPTRELSLLRSLPIFAPLPPATIEHLASRLVSVSVRAGTDVFRQGDRGDRFYVVYDGEVAVLANGQRVASLGPGDFFGEIALLRDAPRMATIRTESNVTLYSLERDEFVAAVSGHPVSTTASESIIAARLAAVRGELRSL